MIANDLRVAGPVGNALGFCAVIEKTLRMKLAYRLSALTSVLTTAFGYSVFLLVWLAVYRENPNVPLIPKGELLPYLLVALVFNATFSLAVELRFGLRLRQGTIALDLLRPLGFLPFQLAQAMGDAIGNLLYSAPLYLLGVMVWGRAVLPPDALHAGLGFASLLLAFLISFGLSYSMMQIAFVTHSQYGVINARLALHQALSGLTAPLAVLPDGLHRVAECLPFRHVIETPVRIWLGLVPFEQISGLMLQQCAWVAGMLLTSTALFDSALRRHQVQGG